MNSAIYIMMKTILFSGVLLTVSLQSRASGNFSGHFSGNPPSESSPVDSLLTEEMIRNLRDPFQIPNIHTKPDMPLTDLEMNQLKDFHLNGVITGPKKIRAMVTGPSGKTYFIGLGERIGTREGKVTAITPDAIKIVEYDIDERGQRVPEILEMRLSGEVVSLSKPEE
jgi:Pilus assembly protein, PilP